MIKHILQFIFKIDKNCLKEEIHDTARLKFISKTPVKF